MTLETPRVIKEAEEIVKKAEFVPTTAWFLRKENLIILGKGLAVLGAAMGGYFGTYELVNIIVPPTGIANLIIRYATAPELVGFSITGWAASKLVRLNLGS